jgi:hypothetical protein
MATAFTTAVTAIPVLLDLPLTSLMEYVKPVLMEVLVTQPTLVTTKFLTLARLEISMALLVVVVALELLIVLQETVSRALGVQLFVLLELQSTTAAVTAVVVEPFTTTHNVKLLLELRVTVFTRTLEVLHLIPELLLQGTAPQQMVPTYLIAVRILGKGIVGQMQQGLFAQSVAHKAA